MEPVAQGMEFEVNTTVAGTQTSSDVTGLTDGGYVVVWRGDGAAGADVFGQRYSADGTPSGGEFQINTPPRPINNLRLLRHIWMVVLSSHGCRCTKMDQGAGYLPSGLMLQARLSVPNFR